VNIPKQLRLEPWDLHDDDVRNQHGIQFEHVRPPYRGAEPPRVAVNNDAFFRGGDDPNVNDVYEQIIGNRRNRDDAQMDPDLINRVKPVRRQKQNPAAEQPNRGVVHPRDRYDDDGAARRYQGAKRNRRAQPNVRNGDEPAPAPSTPARQQSSRRTTNPLYRRGG